MTAPVKLAIFDVDGTLVDSQSHINAAMAEAFAADGLDPPERGAVRAIIGLSLPEAIARLAPDLPVPRLARLVEGYKQAYTHVRTGDDTSPLFPGIRAVLETAFAREDMLAAVATGKSRRGLDHVLALHGLTGRFVSEQVADFHPSKPHPAMLEAVLSETGVAPRDAVMIGDTSFDMEMGRAAGCRTLAVGWGYHDRGVLEACRPDAFVEDVSDLTEAILAALDLAP